MLDALLARHGAPTLAGLKTGTLFSVPVHTQTQLRSSLLHWNRLFLPKGLHLLPLAERNGRTLIYLCRLSALSRDLQHPLAGSLLTEYGYPCPSPERCLIHLRHRLATVKPFPHEIGLFLGYPPEDVRGFLRSPSSCRYSGYWKVYTDPDAARLLFARFRACTRLYTQNLSCGIGPDQLAVSG